MKKEENIFLLNDSDKQDIILNTNNLLNNLEILYSLINEKKINEKEVHSILNLIENNLLKNYSKMNINFDDINKHLNLMFRKDNIQKQMELLEKQVYDKNINSKFNGILEFLEDVNLCLYSWWKREIGFNCVNNIKLINTGVECTFHLALDRVSSLSKTPVSDKEKIEKRYKEMLSEGLSFYKKKNNEFLLLDNDINKKNIINILSNKFKSIKPLKWNNHAINEEYDFILLNVTCIIKDLNELKELINEIKYKK